VVNPPPTFQILRDGVFDGLPTDAQFVIFDNKNPTTPELHTGEPVYIQWERYRIWSVFPRRETCYIDRRMGYLIHAYVHSNFLFFVFN